MDLGPFLPVLALLVAGFAGAVVGPSRVRQVLWTLVALDVVLLASLAGTGGLDCSGDCTGNRVVAALGFVAVPLVVLALAVVALVSGFRAARRA